MISFEFSNGHPHSPHVPATMDDDQYVEYALDDLAGFPCDVEEEERMFMEAVIESLKELETKHPHAQEQPSVSTGSSESSNNTSLATEQDGLKAESTNTSLSNGHSLATSVPPTPAVEAVSVHGSSDADMSSNTRATLTVEKSPTSHIMDGLMRRWDLNFFRNGR